LDGVAGRVLLALAGLLHRGVASRQAVKGWKLRRNEVLRAAHRRVLAARLGLTQSWVRYVIRNPQKAALEEAA
jgi:hypothetical protein